MRAPHLPRTFWLAAPFLVLGLLVAGLALTPLWIARAQAGGGASAHAALVSAVRTLGMVKNFSLVWACAGVVGGILAALLVRRHQRFSREQHERDRERAVELEEFANRVAHDIISPLGPVTAGVHLLSNKLRGDARAQGVATIVRAGVDRVAAIVDELLRFAWSGGRAAPGESADLATAIEAVRDELLPAARASGISLTFEPAPHVAVACAETAIIIVLQNLVRNAIKYIGNGPRKVIRASASVLSGKVRLVVQDTGPGIPAGMEQAVFEPYVRGGDSLLPGLGLGLATVKRIVESRAGSVGVSSTPRRGATFWVELPLTQPVPSGAAGILQR